MQMSQETKKEREMVQKNTKKTTKAAVKSAPRKSPKKTMRPVMAAPVDMPQMHECHCGCHCGCGCRGHRFFGFLLKLLLLVFVFFLGVWSSPWVMHKANKSMMRHMKFDDNGCLVMDSVKCPKMLEQLATADADANGCVTRAELKTVMGEKHKMHKPDMPHRPMMRPGFEAPEM